jgi:hypothetical protein
MVIKITNIRSGFKSGNLDIDFEQHTTPIPIKQTSLILETDLGIRGGIRGHPCSILSGCPYSIFSEQIQTSISLCNLDSEFGRVAAR